MAIRQTIKDLRSGKTTKPTVKTIQSLAEGLWLLNPQNPESIIGWREIENRKLASQMGEGWQVQDIQAVRSGQQLLGEDKRKRLLAVLWDGTREVVETIELSYLAPLILRPPPIEGYPPRSDQ